MWIFRRHIWSHLDVRSPGMPFSQELKNEAYRKGFRCAEVPIEYRHRGGDVKLNAVQDGIRNLRQLFSHRMRRDDVPVHPAVRLIAQSDADSGRSMGGNASPRQRMSDVSDLADAELAVAGVA